MCDVEVGEHAAVGMKVWEHPSLDQPYELHCLYMECKVREGAELPLPLLPSNAVVRAPSSCAAITHDQISCPAICGAAGLCASPHTPQMYQALLWVMRTGHACKHKAL